jgi:hypothetical protein
MWLLLFLEYDFKIVYKPGRSHLMTDASSRLSNQAKLVGVPNHTINDHLFTLYPKWLQNVYDYMLKGIMLERFNISLCRNNIWFKELSHLCYKMEYFIDLDKTIGFVMFYN